MRLKVNVKNPRENRCFQTVIVFSFGSVDNLNKCTVLWKMAAKLIAVSTSVNNEMWVKLSSWVELSFWTDRALPCTGVFAGRVSVLSPGRRKGHERSVTTEHGATPRPSNRCHSPSDCWKTAPLGYSRVPPRAGPSKASKTTHTCSSLGALLPPPTRSSSWAALSILTERKIDPCHTHSDSWKMAFLACSKTR